MVKKLKAEAEVCLISKEIFDDLKLSTEVKYNIHVGQLNKCSYIRPKDIKGSYMYFTMPIFNELLLYNNANLNIWRKGNDIYLGPVVGVFVNTRYLKSIEKLHTPINCKKTMQANEEENCLLYYFSIEDVNWVENKIKGFTFIKRLNVWKHCWLPMPDVVYDRAAKFETNQRLLVSHIKNQFRHHPRIHLINSGDALSKWKVYKYLSKYPKIIGYLPKTIIYKSFQDILNMLKEYGFIFLKASYGSKGRQVLSIEQIGEKYKIDFHSNGLKDELLDIEQLQEFVNEFTTMKNYIVQQGCRLIKHEGRNMDMRVLINKDGSGKWRAIYNICRITSKDATITNYYHGGSYANYKDIYPSLKRENPNINIPSHDEIVNVTIKIATYIEKDYGPFGEIGMDMALDGNGKLWFIEGNAQPDKNPKLGLGDTKIIKLQWLNVLQYAKFLVRGE
ncbi:YheC/YheD family protein [Clostridium aciditolerans]|nr:YheC/YheD family protein [Clostridium aciditolerans]